MTFWWQTHCCSVTLPLIGSDVRRCHVHFQENLFQMNNNFMCKIWPDWLFLYSWKLNMQFIDLSIKVYTRSAINIIWFLTFRIILDSALFNYLKCVMKSSVVNIKEALRQWHHGTEPMAPQHLLGQVGASRLARHPCTDKQAFGWVGKFAFFKTKQGWRGQDILLFNQGNWDDTNT